ncbi:choice-of-anchor D domain-containing protein [Sungkyunkwania multivorans]|uniref:Choice-of-anchor D domain-containing protein n=1 Tax=Sungkyunkwania multivorans TaxID=1173618 RepID=A0ABW3CY38_9FLAO
MKTNRSYRSYAALASLLFCVYTVSFSQTTIAKHSFESSGDTWTPLTLSQPACTSGNSVWDYVTTLSAITPNDGLQFWGIRDLRGPCNGNANQFESIALPNVDVSAFANVTVSFDFYTIGFDNQDDIRYQVFFDGVGQGNVLLVDGGTTNSSTGGWLTETISVPPTVTNVRIVIRVRQNGTSDYAGIDNIRLEGFDPPEMDVMGNGNTILDGASSGSTANDTDFGSITAGSTITKTFTIENNGTGDLDLTGIPTVQLSGSTDFTVTSFPSTPVAAGSSTTFEVTYSPLTSGSDTAIVTINNNDSDESIYDFVIQANATPTGGGPEIDVQGNDLSIFDGDTTPSVDDFTDFGITDLTTPIAIPFFVYNFGTSTLQVTNIFLTGSADFSVTVPTFPENVGTGGDVEDFVVTFTPSAFGTFSTTVTIVSNDSDEGTYTFIINAEVQNLTTPPDGPGGVTSNLRLWLKADSESGSLSDSDPIVNWGDQAYGSTRDANAKATEEPTFLNNPTDNINFNPIVYFDGTKSMYGGQGFYNHDLYIVLKPDVIINSSTSPKDVFCGDDIATNPGSQDVTGFELGNSSARYSGESVAYNQGSESSYGAAEIGAVYTGVQMFNVRRQSGGGGVDLYNNGTLLATTEANTSTYKDIANSRYWIGRSEPFGASYNGSILEIITYDTTKAVGDRNKIESYLAIKYGVTLGVNGTGLDYVDSNGDVIWDASANAGFNYDIAGIGRDDDSALNQKQSKSENTTSEVTIGLRSIESTNSANTNSFTDDRDYLIWGHNGSDLDFTSKTVNVTIGPETITTNTDVADRTWKIIEIATTDVPAVRVSVPTASFISGLPPLTGNDAYVLLVADDAALTVNQETVFLEANGANQEVMYDFNGTKFFTFGVAHEVVASRRMEFDGNDDYIQVGDRVDINAAFTISSWVRTTGSNADNNEKAIVSKDGASGGYKFSLRNNDRVRFENGLGDNITSNTSIDPNIWHHIAITHDGTTANLYIDGVLDNSTAMALPSANSNTFAIGAEYRDSTDIRNEFMGDIDEVRIWDGALSVDQIRFIMNQEIEEFGTGVKGTVLPISVTKNDINTLNWSDLRAYYSMNTYIGTHLNDASGNGNRGNLKNPGNYDVEAQTAPIPYVSTANATWETTVAWENGSGMYTPGASVTINGTPTTIDWNIVQVSHNIDMNSNTKVLALISDSNEVTVQNDSGLTISHYLELEGQIDLEGESQLIQEDNSDLVVTSAGSIERDQQGTADNFTYNYWSSPVGAINTTANNQNIQLANVLMDGTNAASPQSINFQPSINAADGAPTSPITISTGWIYKFVNGAANDYYAWIPTGSAGAISAGEGFTMKGAGTGGANAEQNYVFVGKPNNGDISLALTAGNEYLVGNPYPSAIDADAFILDNTSTTGTLYFWQHWGGNSHVLGDYQGGYALYNLAGGVEAASHPDVNQAGTGTKTPERYIPVAQGFYVVGNTSGTVNFENDQRTFITEGSGNSVYIRGNGHVSTRTSLTDARTKVNLKVTTPGGIVRRLLLTLDENTTYGIDWAYDAKLTESQYDDAYWLIEDQPHLIQAIPNFDADKSLSLGMNLTNSGTIRYELEHIENDDASLELYLLDKLTYQIYDLQTTAVEVTVNSGMNNDRFEVVFNNSSLSVDDQQLVDESGISFEYIQNLEAIRVASNNSSLGIEKLLLFNIFGQQLLEWNIDRDMSEIKVNSLATGSYIMKLVTSKGEIAKKFVKK